MMDGPLLWWIDPLEPPCPHPGYRAVVGLLRHKVLPAAIPRGMLLACVQCDEPEIVSLATYRQMQREGLIERQDG